MGGLDRGPVRWGLELETWKGDERVLDAAIELTPTAEAGVGWPRKDNFYHGLERPAGGCRSGSGG